MLSCALKLLLEEVNMAAFYANPSYMTVGNYIVYSDAQRQRGGAFLSSFRSAIAPVEGELRTMHTMGREKVVKCSYALCTHAPREKMQHVQDGT